MNSNDFNMKYGQKELFEFRMFLKYLHGRSNMFPGVDIHVRGDGTWKSVKENSSYSDLESWNIYLKINNFADPKKHNTNAAIDFVKEQFCIEMTRSKIVCRHSADNNQCIGKRCPFSPGNREG